MSSSSACLSLEHFSPALAEQLCYVHCNFCDTVLAVCSFSSSSSSSSSYYYHYYNHYFNYHYYYSSFPETSSSSGECSLQQPVQDSHSEMRALHQPPLRQHESPLAASSRPVSLLQPLLFPSSSQLTGEKYVPFNYTTLSGNRCISPMIKRFEIFFFRRNSPTLISR